MLGKGAQAYRLRRRMRHLSLLCGSAGGRRVVRLHAAGHQSHQSQETSLSRSRASVVSLAVVGPIGSHGLASRQIAEAYNQQTRALGSAAMCASPLTSKIMRMRAQASASSTPASPLARCEPWSRTWAEASSYSGLNSWSLLARRERRRSIRPKWGRFVPRQETRLESVHCRG